MNASIERQAKLAYMKVYELQTLVDTLNNTTVGSLSSRIDDNDTDISNLQNADVALSSRIDSNDTDISNLQNADVALSAAIDIVNTKISTIASIFSIIFNIDGTLNTEAYSSHTHSYSDGTISDTADGTGIQTDTPRNTQGIN